MKGRILLFTGDGKGKTTAALGTAFRALGHDARVFVIQFIKSDRTTGEVLATPAFKNLRMLQMGLGFIPPHENPKFTSHQQAAEEALALAQQSACSDEYDLLVLDEICIAVASGLIPVEDVLHLLRQKRESLNVILTGRGAVQELIDAADTVTEMRCIKHAYQQGIPAMKGVEC